MALTAEQLEQQKKQAEELLFSGPQTLGFAKGLFFGHFNGPLVFPYPDIKPDERKRVEKAVLEVRRFAEEKINAMAIDRNADIPPEVVSGLGHLGVLGMTALLLDTELTDEQRDYVEATRSSAIGHCSNPSTRGSASSRWS